MGSLPINSEIRSIVVDLKTPQRVYAAGPGGLFRSDDGGLNWTEADKGLTSKPLAVTLIPATPQTVFVVLADNAVWQSTDGAATWHQLKAGQ